jgi:hypothetical protein
MRACMVELSIIIFLGGSNLIKTVESNLERIFYKF